MTTFGNVLELVIMIIILTVMIITLVVMLLITTLENYWVYDQSPTLARSGKDHRHIRMDKYFHWYEVFWVKAKSKFMRYM